MALAYPRTCRRRTGSLKYGRAKLTTYAVEDIRTWARTEGFGLSVMEQVSTLQALFPGYAALSPATLREVLRNESWFDPSYDRETPFLAPTDAMVASNPVGASMLATRLQLWLVTLLMLMVLTCYSSPSRSNVR